MASTYISLWYVWKQCDKTGSHEHICSHKYSKTKEISYKAYHDIYDPRLCYVDQSHKEMSESYSTPKLKGEKKLWLYFAQRKTSFRTIECILMTIKHIIQSNFHYYNAKALINVHF